MAKKKSKKKKSSKKHRAGYIGSALHKYNLARKAKKQGKKKAKKSKKASRKVAKKRSPKKSRAKHRRTTPKLSAAALASYHKAKKALLHSYYAKAR